MQAPQLFQAGDVVVRVKDEPDRRLSSSWYPRRPARTRCARSGRILRSEIATPPSQQRLGPQIQHPHASCRIGDRSLTAGPRGAAGIPNGKPASFRAASGEFPNQSKRRSEAGPPVSLLIAREGFELLVASGMIGAPMTARISTPPCSLLSQEVEPPEIVLDRRDLAAPEPGLRRITAHGVLAHDRARARGVFADHAHGKAMQDAEAVVQTLYV